MTKNFDKDAAKLYEQYHKMLWWFSHKYGIDIGDCEIAFMQCVKNYDGDKSSFSNYLWLSLKNAVWKHKREGNAIKRKTEKMITGYQIDWLGVTYNQSIWQFAKEILLPTDYQLLFEHFGNGKSQKEIAENWNMSQTNVSRKINQIIGIMRANLGVVKK